MNRLPIPDDDALRRLIRDEVSPLLRQMQDRAAHSGSTAEVVRLEGRLERLESSLSTGLAQKADSADYSRLKAKHAELREVVLKLTGKVNQAREDLLHVATQVGSFAEAIVPKRMR